MYMYGAFLTKCATFVMHKQKNGMALFATACEMV